MMFTTYLLKIKAFLNKVTLSRRRIFKLFARTIFKRFLNDSSTNFQEAYILIDFSHLT